jgi:enoyl-CoA hydratase
MMTDVLFHVEGAVGRITLNRPKAINALTHDMVLRITGALRQWESDPAVQLVLLDGAGNRGLCAGGDIRALYDAARDGDFGITDAFFRDEYRMNAAIATYPKPYIALMDGIVMGGGIGLSAHGWLRIVTERSKLAMPEVGIGFVPDVGGTYLLSNAPGELGTHAALTAARLGPADAILCGLADHFIPGDRLPGLIDAICAVSTPDEVLAMLSQWSEPPPAGELTAARDWIDACYGAESVEEILARLRSDARPGPDAAIAAIAAVCPASLKATLRALRIARRLAGLEACLEMEFTVARASLRRPDFVEGVRAAVVDKDRMPRWSPSRLEDVTPAELDLYFIPVNDERLIS